MSERRATASRVGSDLSAAFRFLTILPTPRVTGAASSFGAWAFPLVGLGLALALWPVATLAAAPLLASLLLVALAAVLTGGLHWDGLADVADALGGRDRASRVSILRDSRVGSFGVLAIVFGVGLQVAALASLPEASRWVAFASALASGRAAILWLAWRGQAARPGGLGDAFLRALEGLEVAVATLLALLVVLLCGGGVGAVALVCAALVTLGLRRVGDVAFGGVSGDLLGAAVCLSEVVVLCMFAFSWGTA